MFIAEALDEIAQEEGTNDQKELAKIIGVTQGTISNYYAGKTDPTKKVATFIFAKYGHRCEPFTVFSLEGYKNDN